MFTHTSAGHGVRALDINQLFTVITGQVVYHICWYAATLGGNLRNAAWTIGIDISYTRMAPAVNLVPPGGRRSENHPESIVQAATHCRTTPTASPTTCKGACWERRTTGVDFHVACKLTGVTAPRTLQVARAVAVVAGYRPRWVNGRFSLSGSWSWGEYGILPKPTKIQLGC